MLGQILHPVGLRRFLEDTRRNLFRRFLASLTFAQPGIGPFETLGHDVSDIGEVEEKQRNAYDGVEYGDEFPNWSDGGNVTIA